MAKSTAPFDIWHPQVTLTFSSCPGTRRTADEPQRCGRRPPSVLIQRARITLGRNDDARENSTSAGSPSETRHNNARATACSSSTTLPRTPSHGARHHGSRTLAQRHFLPRGVPRGGRRACRSPATRYDDGFPHHPRDDSLTRPPFPPRSSSPTSSPPRAGSWSLWPVPPSQARPAPSTASSPSMSRYASRPPLARYEGERPRSFLNVREASPRFGLCSSVSVKV